MLSGNVWVWGDSPATLHYSPPKYAQGNKCGEGFFQIRIVCSYVLPRSDVTMCPSLQVIVTGVGVAIEVSRIEGIAIGVTEWTHPCTECILHGDAILKFRMQHAYKKTIVFDQGFGM